MPLDGVTAFYLAEELNDALAGARIDKVQQPSRTDILLSVRSLGKNRKLILSANPSQPRIHFTEEAREMPKIAPRFCMLLRKYLIGSRIEKVETVGFDRVFIFHISSQDELGDKSQRRLILEVMGRYSNLIFVSNEDIIIDAINHVDHQMSRVREVMPARPFVPAPAQDKLEPADALTALSEAVFWPTSESLSYNHKLEKYLLDNIQGVSPQLSRDFIQSAGLDLRHSYQSLNDSERVRLDLVLKDKLASILAFSYEPSLFYKDDENTPFDFHALPLEHMGIRQSRASISDCMMEYYTVREADNQFKQRRQFLERTINQARAKLRKKRDIHARDVDSSKNFDRYREKADILMSNLHLIQEGDKELVTIDFYDPEMKEIKIELNPHRSPAWNGQHLYKLYNKNKTRHEQASRFLKEDNAEFLWLDSIANEISNAKTMEDLGLIRDEMRQGKLLDTTGPKQALHAKKQHKKSKRVKTQEALPMRRFTSTDGFTILAGRNNLQNDQLTLRIAQKNDLWFHVQKAPGTHVVVRTEGKEVPDQTLLEAAEIAAWFSRSGKAGRDIENGGAKIAIDYCPVSHVRKPGGARPGMVIYDRYQTILAEAKNPDHLGTKAGDAFSSSDMD